MNIDWSSSPDEKCEIKPACCRRHHRQSTVNLMLCSTRPIIFFYIIKIPAILAGTILSRYHSVSHTPHSARLIRLRTHLNQRSRKIKNIPFHRDDYKSWYHSALHKPFGSCLDRLKSLSDVTVAPVVPTGTVQHTAHRLNFTGILLLPCTTRQFSEAFLSATLSAQTHFRLKLWTV